MPPDYASGGASFALRTSKSGDTGIGEDLESGVTVNGGFQDFDSVVITATGSSVHVIRPDVTYGPRDSVSVNFGVNSDPEGPQATYNDQVDLHSIEFRCTAIQ